MAVAAFSTVVEWYDFTLYLYLATVLSRVFFAADAHSVSRVLASFAVAYLVRPLGALVFGYVGDRYGRRRAMLWSMSLMTAAMLATALLPTRAQAGPAAGWLLLALRCLMGFCVGGEYNAVVAYLIESARPSRRGLTTSLASAASEVGGLLAVGVCAVTLTLLPGEAVDAWGWRIPFFVGAALAAAILFGRSGMEESPDFTQQQANSTVPRNPLRQAIFQDRAAVARGFAISALGSITYYVGIAYVPTFLAAIGHINESDALWLSTAAAMVAIAVTPLTGALSDRLGRRPVLLLMCLAAALLPVTMFSLMAQGGATQALVGAFVLAAVGGGMSAVGAVTTAELFGGEGRLSGLAMGASSATALFGGLTPYVSQRLMAATGWPMAPGALIALVALAALPVLLTLPETRPERTF